MKMNFLRGLAFALATGGLLSSASAQYSGATMLPPYQQQVAYFQDAVPPPPAPPVDIQAPPAHQGSPVGSGLWGDYCSGDYGFAGCGCTTNCCGPWYGYAGGLIM